MANLKQVLTYAQTFEINFPSGNDVPVTNPVTNYPGTDVDVTNSYAAEINGTELFRGDVTVASLGAADLVLCNVATASQCFAYIQAEANNTDSITISYVDESSASTAIATLAPGESLYIPFFVSIAIPAANCKLTGTAVSGTQRVYVSASHNG